MLRVGGVFALLLLLGAAALPSATIFPATGTFVCFCCIDIEDRPGPRDQRSCNFPNWDAMGEFAHPRTGSLRLPVSQSVPGNVRACVDYANTLGRAEGRIKVRVKLLREDRVVDEASFGGRVRRREQEDPFDLGTVFYGCTEPGDLEPSLEAGDVLVFSLRYRGFPDLTKSGLFVLTVGVVR